MKPEQTEHTNKGGKWTEQNTGANMKETRAAKQS